MKRKRHHYLVQYVLLPVILIVSDVMIGVFSHYSGTVGVWNIFSVEHFADYFIHHTDELLFILLVAIAISLIVEYYVKDLEKK